MWLIDVILNLAALLLWLKWRDTRKPQAPAPGISLVGTLNRPRASSAAAIFLIILFGLLIVRWVFYWQLGSALHWTPRISFGVISVAFRSDNAWRIFVYSFFSFAMTLGIYYFTLLFFSVVNGRKADNDPLQRVVDDQLGWVVVLPTPAKIILAWAAMLILWVPLSWALVWLGVMPAPLSLLHQIEQGAVIGVAMFFVWRFVLAGLLFLYLLNSYVYLGNSPFWSFVHLTGRRLVSWLPLRIGKIDFAPVVLAVAVLLGTEILLNGMWGLKGLVWVYQQLPF